MILFIISEVFFFLRFFWAYFHSSLSVVIEAGGVWPPVGIVSMDSFTIPLLNTLVLLSSGVRVTWAHHRIIAANHRDGVSALWITIILGVYFTLLQLIEYYEASFSFCDGTYGSTFFLATGFHGFHVLVGTLFLTVRVLRLIQNLLNFRHHLGVEIAA
jgi:cytochrome c oxidase subunit 3